MCGNKQRRWLVDTLEYAQDSGWCIRPWCGTCGSLEFRRAIWKTAAQQAGINSNFDVVHQSWKILKGVRIEDLEQLIRALVAALRELPSRLADPTSDAFKVIMIDLDSQQVREKTSLNIDAMLYGTYAGAALERMRAHHEEVLAERERQKEYESPRAVEERRQIKRERIAAAHALRQAATLKKNSERLELLDTLARMSSTKRLSYIATTPDLNIDMVADELVPKDRTELKDLEKEHTVTIIEKIDRRKGAWGHLRRGLEKRLNAETKLEQ